MGRTIGIQQGFDSALVLVSHDEGFLRAIGIGRVLAVTARQRTDAKGQKLT